MLYSSERYMRTPSAIFSSVISCLLLLTSTPVVYAQETESTSLFGDRDEAVTAADFYSPPPVFVDEIDAAQNQTGTYDVRFSVHNTGTEVVGSIGYRLELLSPAQVLEEGSEQIVNDAPDVYDSVTGAEAVTVVGGDTKFITTTYTPPKVPAGEYRLRAQLVTSNGRELGWNDIPVSITSGAEGPFALLLPGTFEIAGHDELIPPLSGPNISPGDSFSVRSTIRNVSSQDGVFIPRVQVYRFDSPETVINEVTADPVSVAAGTDNELSIALTAPSNPAVYRARVDLVTDEGEKISTTSLYHWVVRGLGANIISARIVEYAGSAGGQIITAVDYTGPADAETSTVGNLSVAIVDEQGVAGSVTIPEDIELTDEVIQGYARITLNRDVIGTPAIEVKITDKDGAVLATYSSVINLSEEETAMLDDNTQSGYAADSTVMFLTQYRYPIAIGLVVVVLVLILMLVISRRKPPITPIALFLVGTLGFVGWIHQVDAQINVVTSDTMQQLCQRIRYSGAWCSLPGRVVEVFVNQPHHNRTSPTYNRTSTPLQIRVTQAGCNNAVDTTYITPRYDRSGKLFASLNGAGAAWQQFPQVAISAACQTNWCQLSSNYNANLSFSSLPKHISQTTLQLQAIYRRIAVNYGTRAIDLQNAINLGSAHVVNVWVKFTPTPQCSDGIDNDGDGYSDSRDPGCHTDGIPTNPGSYQPTDDDERDPVVVQQPVNQAPIAEGSASVNGAYTQNIIVTQGVPFSVGLRANFDIDGNGLVSRDPDGWGHATFGVANGGKCEWNADLDTGGSFEKVIPNPANPGACSTTGWNITIDRPPGTYTVPLLRVTDAAGTISNTSNLSIIVRANTNPRLACIGPAQAVVGQPVTFQAQSYGNPISGQWEVPIGITKTGAGANFVNVFPPNAVGAPRGVRVNAIGSTAVCTINVLPSPTPVPDPIPPTPNPNPSTPGPGTPSPAVTTITPTPAVPECSDGIDDDGDGLVDCADNGCWTDPNDSSTCDSTNNSEFLPATEISPGPFQETE